MKLEKNAGNGILGTFAPLHCAIFRTPRFCKSLFGIWDFLCLFGSRNSRTTGILHTTRHVYKSVWSAREAKPRFGTALERSEHDRETRLLFIYRQDFEACTQALQDMGYSTPALTAARGVSAGGLVLGAVCNRSPDLFRAAVLKVCERNSCAPDDNSGFLSIGR